MSESEKQNCPCGETCPIGRAMGIISGKWKMQVLCVLITDQIARYGELKRKVNGITNTMLASTLKELEKDGLITRTQYNEMPLRVEYAATSYAESLRPIIGQLLQWANQQS